jgi:SagB-type dehydrogenase family enzyme
MANDIQADPPLRRRVQPVKRGLPPPSLTGPMSLEEAIRSRRSFRDFDEHTLDDGELAQLFWAAQGVTDAAGHRSAPSNGDTYPVELYAAVPDGVLHYLPVQHAVEYVGYDGDIRFDLMNAALGQPSIAVAGAIFVISVVESRGAKFGERAERYVLLEAGHVAQNLLLQATAIGLRCTPIGNVDDISVHRVMGIESRDLPVYLVAVGGPRDRPQ